MAPRFTRQGSPGCCAFGIAALLAGCEDFGPVGDLTQLEALVPVTQAGLDGLAGDLRFELAVLDNQPASCLPDAPFGACHDAQITLRNTGDSQRWQGFALYYTSGHRVLGVSSQEFRIRHLSGTLHVIEPTSLFSGWAAGEAKQVRLQAGLCMIAETDAQPRAYLAAPGLRPAIVANTDSEDPSTQLAALESETQTRCPGSSAVLASAETRFDENASLSDLGAGAVSTEIIPRPLSLAAREGSIDLARGLRVDADVLGTDTVAALRQRISELALEPQSGAAVADVTIDASDAAFAGKSPTQAYRLSIGPDAIQIIGADAAGAFYGVQSLLALAPAPQLAQRTLPALDIPYDAPRYAYRGLHVDVARNFHGLPELLKLLQQMAAYKLDALRLHLSDDEGFRLEIPGLPELTDFAARRCHSEDPSGCLEPQLGSGPFTDTSGSGYFTRDEFITLLRAAQALQIEVVPGFDLPAHARAAIRAMALRRRRGDASYALDDPADESEYLSPASYDDNVLNPCQESSYAFVAKLMDEVQAMYRDAGVALRTWHVGADEVPAGAWTRSPVCDALFASGGAVKSAADVQAAFITRVNALALERGLGLRAWTEGWQKPAADGTLRFLDPATDLGGNTVSVNWWAPLASFYDGLAPLARLGYGIILSSGDYTLFDHPQEADPKERGLIWATRYNDTRKLFSYLPGNLAANAQLLAECQGGDCDAAVMQAMPIANPERVLGIEAQLWSETIRTDEEFEYMLFPRLLALAERSWHRAAWEPSDGMDAAALIDRVALAADWERFANTLGHKELPKLDRAGVRFRLEVPGATLRDGRLRANIAAPGLGIQYRNEAGEFLAYDAAQAATLTRTEVRAVSAEGRAGRAVSVP